MTAVAHEEVGITFEEAVQYLENCGEINLRCDGYSYEISKSENWMGGDVAEGFISLALGNIVYSDAEEVVRASMKFLSRDGRNVSFAV